MLLVVIPPISGGRGRSWAGVRIEGGRGLVNDDCHELLLLTCATCGRCESVESPTALWGDDRCLAGGSKHPRGQLSPYPQSSIGAWSTTRRVGYCHRRTSDAMDTWPTQPQANMTACVPGPASSGATRSQG